jgi:hypothetical protein
MITTMRFPETAVVSEPGTVKPAMAAALLTADRNTFTG